MEETLLLGFLGNRKPPHAAYLTQSIEASFLCDFSLLVTGRQETGGDLGRALTHPVPVPVFLLGGGQPRPLAGLAVDYLDTHKVCGK